MELHLKFMEKIREILDPYLEPLLWTPNQKVPFVVWPFFGPKVCSWFGKYSWATQSWRCGGEECHFTHEVLFLKYVAVAEKIYNPVIKMVMEYLLNCPYITIMKMQALPACWIRNPDCSWTKKLIKS